MTLSALTDLNQIPASAADACRQFDYRYSMAAASVAASNWSKLYGDYSEPTTPNVRYPLSYAASRYQEYRGEIVSKPFKDGFFDLTTTEYYNSAETEWLKLSTNPLEPKVWYANAERFANDEQRHMNSAVAALFVANAACQWDKLSLFNASHLVDPTNTAGPTFSNLQASVTDLTQEGNLLAEVTAMQNQVVDINGENMEADPDVILAGPLLAKPLDFMLSQSMLNNSTNPFYQKFKVVLVAQPGMGKSGILLDTKIMSRAMEPWIITKFIPPDPTGKAAQLRFFDENSDHFKRTGRLLVSSHIHHGVAALFPHAVRFVTGQ